MMQILTMKWMDCFWRKLLTGLCSYPAGLWGSTSAAPLCVSRAFSRDLGRFFIKDFSDAKILPELHQHWLLWKILPYVHEHSFVSSHFYYVTCLKTLPWGAWKCIKVITQKFMQIAMVISKLLNSIKCLQFLVSCSKLTLETILQRCEQAKVEQLSFT